jgi:hypothetical protein
MATSSGNLQTEMERLERKHPGKTIVLNARTMEVLVASKSDTVIARKVKDLDENIVPLFIGGPETEDALAFHHFCRPQKHA